MKRLIPLFMLACVVFCQDVLNNDAVVKMTKAGLSETIILSTVQSSPGKYSTKPDDLVGLKGQGVSDKVIAAMISRGASPQSAEFSDTGDIPANIEVGLYYKKDGKWDDMLPEVVNWKTGGVLKGIATAGIVKGDVNGHVNGAHSRTVASDPVEILIYAPEGSAITEYQLVHLHEQSDAREFRTITGGIMHVSGGATRDLLPFEGKKVAPRTYKVTLSSLGAGEYGILPPGAFTSSTGAASLGKAYTFQIPNAPR